VDPLAMKFPNISPYAFSANNPINYVDPDGRAPESIYGTDPVFAPRVRPTSGNLNKSRFRMVNRINSDGSIRQHHGVDILASKGTSLKSALAGEVVSVRNSFKAGQYAKNSYGNFIIVKSEVEGAAVFMKYAHLDKVNIKVGDQVSAGTEIGLTGNTGNAVGLSDDQDHVHIEASKGGDYFNLDTRIDPEQFFETKFDSQGNPVNLKTLTDSEVNNISNFINDITNEQNFIGPDPVSLPEL
jgi:murein DD-endopeptidase MepM/ murein hydrolase activator NlpD